MPIESAGIRKTTCAIVPTFNRKEMVQDCIDSLLNQTLPPDEILVIDDGSTDGTQEALAKYGEKIRYIRKNNGGKSSALNEGLRNTLADYIWICDDDDYAAPNGLETLVRALEATPEAGFAHGNFEIFRVEADGKKTFITPYYKPRANETNLEVNLLEDLMMFQFATLVKRSLYEKTGFFDETLLRSQDYEMALRLARHAKGVYVPQTIFFQRLHHGDRGAGRDRFKNSETHAKWLHYEQIYFSRIAANYDLKSFVPSFAATWERPLRDRAAYLERGLILARRGLWKYTFADIGNAIAAANAPLTSEERHICEIIVRLPAPWMVLAQDSILCQQLNNIYRQGGLGAEIILALCRPLGWMTKLAVRKGDLKSALDYIRLLNRILGPKGTILRFAESAKNKQR